jgi:N-acetylglucosamine-6-phosphate deacetylase
MPDGEYMLGGQPFTMKDGKATLTGTDTLAGSSIHLLDGLKRSVSFGIPLERAVLAATMTPAKVIRKESEIGSLCVGKCADIVVLDSSLDIKAVLIDGKIIGK